MALRLAAAICLALLAWLGHARFAASADDSAPLRPESAVASAAGDASPVSLLTTEQAARSAPSEAQTGSPRGFSIAQAAANTIIVRSTERIPFELLYARSRQDAQAQSIAVDGANGTCVIEGASVASREIKIPGHAWQVSLSPETDFDPECLHTFMADGRPLSVRTERLGPLLARLNAAPETLAHCVLAGQGKDGWCVASNATEFKSAFRGRDRLDIELVLESGWCGGGFLNLVTGQRALVSLPEELNRSVHRGTLTVVAGDAPQQDEWTWNVDSLPEFDLENRVWGRPLQTLVVSGTWGELRFSKRDNYNGYRSEGTSNQARFPDLILGNVYGITGFSQSGRFVRAVTTFDGSPAVLTPEHSPPVQLEIVDGDLGRPVGSTPVSWVVEHWDPITNSALEEWTSSGRGETDQLGHLVLQSVARLPIDPLTTGPSHEVRVTLNVRGFHRAVTQVRLDGPVSREPVWIPLLITKERPVFSVASLEGWNGADREPIDLYVSDEGETRSTLATLIWRHEEQRLDVMLDDRHPAARTIRQLLDGRSTCFVLAHVVERDQMLGFSKGGDAWRLMPVTNYSLELGQEQPASQPSRLDAAFEWFGIELLYRRYTTIPQLDGFAYDFAGPANGLALHLVWIDQSGVATLRQETHALSEGINRIVVN